MSKEMSVRDELRARWLVIQISNEMNGMVAENLFRQSIGDQPNYCYDSFRALLRDDKSLELIALLYPSEED